MKKLDQDDQAVIQSIKAGGLVKERTIGSLINQYINFTYSIQNKLGISADDAQDAFTDAILAVVSHIERDVFRGDSKLSTYLYRIFYNKSVDLARKKSTNKTTLTYEIPEIRDESNDLLKQLDVKEDFSQLKELLNQLGEKCKQILLDWGFWGYTMEEIAQRAELKNAKSAKNRKYKCLERLTKLIDQNPITR